MTPSKPAPIGLKRILPAIGSPAYHLTLGAVAIFVLGPLGGVSAAFMNFSIGFFVGGQVLAGILGSSVTLPYGPEGKHGANYMQTMAASVASLCAMGVLLQAMIWLGLPEPPAWKLVLYFLCIGMFGVGVGMLYTPVLVDRMQLKYPSGFAVANILRALTDPNLLKRSVAKLGGGMAGGFAAFHTTHNLASISAWGLSASTLGAGMIVGARIAIPALVVALIGLWQTPYLVRIGWLAPGEPFRKIGFIIALGTILGAAILDITLILIEAARRYRQKNAEPVNPAEDWKRVNVVRLIVWVVFWGAGVVIVGSQVLQQPVFLLTVALGLCFLFVVVNGISLGISDWNPISSAFVVTVFILAALGLKDPAVGLMCASILLIGCAVGGDMQQDRSTGWRLGTNRLIQFRYQVIGIAMGAVLAVALAKVFMNAYPILREDTFTNPNLEGAKQWQSAMTYKLVGALKGITKDQPHLMEALRFGILLGLLIEIVRKLVKHNLRYKEFTKGSRTGRATDFVFDAVLVPSPYASSFGGFVELRPVLWWVGGGLLPGLYDSIRSRLNNRNGKPAETGVPEDMSTMSLVGGGLIAGDSLAALSVGIFGLLKTLL
jgi:uncharacterized oligopeptide transporter (OPT) family protein